MAYDRFMIAPVNSGLQKDKKPWAIPEDAFETLNNAYCWRGRIRKRFGSRVMNELVPENEYQYHTRLRTQPYGVDIGVIDGAGAFAGNITGPWYLGQYFQIIDGINDPVFRIDNFIAGPQTMVRMPAGGATHTFDIATGNFAFTGETPASHIYFYRNGFPTLDVSGVAAGVVEGTARSVGQMISINNESFTVVSNVAGFQNMNSTLYTITPPSFYIGNTNGAGAIASVVLPLGNRIGQSFQLIDGIDNPIFKIDSNFIGPQPMVRIPTGAPGPVHTFDPGTGTVNITGEAPNAPLNLWYQGFAQFNITTGQYLITMRVPFPVDNAVHFYPSTPVMGFVTYQTALINDNATFAFDTQFAYEYIAGAWQRLGTETWTGNDTQYFWGASWRAFADFGNTLFVTNYNGADHIKYWDGQTWTVFTPLTKVADSLQGCRLLIVFKNRLLAFNTIETEAGIGTNSFVNRMRCSQKGNPTAVDAWRTDIPGRGFYNDAPTKEPIITATIIKDRLIVYFESSTYELVYTGNDVGPFIWQQINSELGSQSTFSKINFDTSILAIGATGIHSCNGNSVDRIDDKIPDDVIEIFSNGDGTRRTCGIRDFTNQMVYWSIPYSTAMGLPTDTYPNKILAYNYENGSWAYFDDSITAFGYYEKQTSRTWAQISTQWYLYDETWGGGDLQTHPRLLMCGNQQGFTFIADANYSKNSMSLQITAIDPATMRFTVINHNLPTVSYVYISNCQGITDFNDQIYQVEAVSQDVILVNLHAGDPFPDPAGVYFGGGTLSRVSQIDIYTKQFNFYIDKNRNAAIQKVDFLVNNNNVGEITVECFPSYSRLGLVDQANVNACNLGTSVLELVPYATVPLEASQDQFWHPVYFNAEGESVQFRLYLSNEQMIVNLNAFSGFQLQAMTIYTTPTSFTTR